MAKEPAIPVCPGCKHYDEVSTATTLGKGRCHEWKTILAVSGAPKLKKFQYWPTGYDGSLVFKCDHRET